MLEHIGSMQKFWDHCDAGKLSSTVSRLDKLENQCAAQAQKEISLETAINETKEELAKQGQIIEKQKNAVKKPFQYCFGTKFYYIEEIQKLNWFAAAHKCREFGGNLLSLANQKEHDALRPKLNSLNSYWIDINDLSTENEFLSLTSGHKAPFMSWGTGEPNNAEKIENCVLLTGETFFMNDFKCTSPEYFICESTVESIVESGSEHTCEKI